MIMSTGGRGLGGLLVSGVLLAIGPISFAQNAPATAARGTPSTTTPEIDPTVLKAVKTMSDQLKAATAFSFSARIMREEPGTNGQMLDFFRYIDVKAERPDKMRIDVKADGSDTTLWYDGKNLTLMPATAKIYTVIPASGTLEAALTTLSDKLDAHMPLRPFLSSDPDAILTEGLQSANDVGFVNVGDERLLQLAFTEPDANWQLWLSGPKPILPRGMAITYKNVEGAPRVYIEFSDWNLNAKLPSSTFVFSKPAGAVEVSLNALRPKEPQQGGKSK